MTPVSVSEQDRLGSIALDQWRGLALVLVLISHGFFFTNRVNGIGRVTGQPVLLHLRHFGFSFPVAHTGRDGVDADQILLVAAVSTAVSGLALYSVVMLVGVWWLQRLPHLPPRSDFDSYLRAWPVALIYGTNYYTQESPLSLGHLWSLRVKCNFIGGAHHLPPRRRDRPATATRFWMPVGDFDGTGVANGSSGSGNMILSSPCGP